MSRLGTGVAIVLMLGGPAFAQTPSADTVKQDSKILRFAQRAMAWFPDSTFRVVEDERRHTPSGSYRVVGVERTCTSASLTGTISLVIDEVADMAWIGNVGELPFRETSIGADALRTYLEDFLPGALRNALRLDVRVDWDDGGIPSGALIPVTLQVETGYGEFPMMVAVSSDGGLLVIGSAMPFDQDPVEYRRRLLATNEVVMWDHPRGDPPAIEIVEFSDLECPACKRRWGLVKQVLDTEGAAVRHGMVSYPLTSIHPWSFRAASATWCVAAQAPEQTVPFKEQFYSMQSDMELAMVRDVAQDFVDGRGLDAEDFGSCFLKSPSIGPVHDQIALARRLGLSATPSYVVSGWLIQVPAEDWFPDMVSRLVKGEEP